MDQGFDLIVIGAGIVGLGAALAGVRAGKSVAVVDRDARANGASIRNFGFVTVTGQKAGAHWARARRTRDIWAEVAPQAGIGVLQAGLVMPAYRPEAAEVEHAFLQTDMGAECRLITQDEAKALIPALRMDGLTAVMFSPHELRVESREALPKLAAWLAETQGVRFFWQTSALEVTDKGVVTRDGLIRADAVVVCPGDDFTTLFPEVIGRNELTKCTLQMLRIAAPGMPRLQAPVMSDHSLARYEGFAELEAARPLIDRLNAETPAMRAAGIHLIAVQSADGSLVVGDSHVYGPQAEPFARAEFDDLIVQSFDDVLDLPGRHVTERWCGSYPSSSSRTILVERPAANIRLVMVTGGTGASTGFALGEQVVADLFSPTADVYEALK